MYTYIEFPKEKNNEMISILRIGLCIERESDIKKIAAEELSS